MLAFRNFDYSQQNTTSALEAYHGALKQLDLNTSRTRLVGRRLDWLIDILLRSTEARYRINFHLKRAGYLRNKKAEDAVRASIEGARGVDAARVALVDRTAGSANVSSPNHEPGYVVADALTAHPICSCPCGIRGSICKHIVKVMRMLHKSEPEILQVWGTYRGTTSGDERLAGWLSATSAAAAEPGGAEQGGGEELGGSTSQAGGAEQAGSADQAGGAEHAGGTGTEIQPAAATSGSTAARRVDFRAQCAAGVARMVARLADQPSNGAQWEAAASAVAIMESTVGILTASTNMLAGLQAPAPLPANPLAPAGMSKRRLPSFLENRASRSSSQRCSQPLAIAASQTLQGGSDAASAKPARPVPLQPARQTGVKRARNLAELVAKKLGPKVSQIQGLLPEALPAPPTSGNDLLQQAAQQQPVAGSMMELGDIFDFDLGPLLYDDVQ